MSRKKSSKKGKRKGNLRALKKAIPLNPQMSRKAKQKALATVNRKLARLRPSFRPRYQSARNDSGRLMREGLKETGEVALGWISEPISKVIEAFHFLRGSAKIAKAIEQEG